VPTSSYESRRLVMNCTRARDAMPNGGTLAISTRVTELDESYAVHHPGVTAGAYLAIDAAERLS
jgi:hypothetical protein